MKARFKRLLRIFFLTIGKSLILAFAMQSLVKGQDSFEKIEIDLRKKQSEAIENIKKEFFMVPDVAWENADGLIDTMRKQARELFFEDPQALYFFQPPKLNTPFKNHSELFSFLSWNEKAISLATLSSYLTKCLSARGIKQGSVCCTLLSSELLSLKAAGHNDDLSRCLAFVKGVDIPVYVDNQVTFTFNKNIYCNIDKLEEVSHLFPIVPCVIQHELTHLTEAHPGIIDILQHVIKEYYPDIDLNNAPSIINLLKVHELIADVVPAIICPSVAFLYCNQALLNKLYLISNRPGPYETFFELKEWAKRIIKCHESIHGKTSIYDQLSFAIQIPAMRTMLFCAFSLAFGLTSGFMYTKT